MRRTWDETMQWVRDHAADADLDLGTAELIELVADGTATVTWLGDPPEHAETRVCLDGARELNGWDVSWRWVTR